MSNYEVKCKSMAPIFIDYYLFLNRIDSQETFYYYEKINLFVFLWFIIIKHSKFVVRSVKNPIHNAMPNEHQANVKCKM